MQVILAAELLKQARPFIDDGVHPQVGTLDLENSIIP